MQRRASRVVFDVQCQLYLTFSTGCYERVASEPLHRAHQIHQSVSCVSILHTIHYVYFFISQIDLSYVLSGMYVNVSQLFFCECELVYVLLFMNTYPLVHMYAIFFIFWLYIVDSSFIFIYISSFLSINNKYKLFKIGF